jgi:hypothetical protein
MGAFQGGPGMAAVTVRMSGLEGRLQWRQHKLFKLRAKPFALQKFQINQCIGRKLRRNGATHPARLFAF